MRDREVILDACCLINLAAAGDLVELLRATQWAWHLPRTVEMQRVSIRLPSGEREVVDLERVVQAACLKRCDLDDNNRPLFLELAAVHGDDADAAALTIAETQGYRLATDDNRLARLASVRMVQTLSTAAILRRVATKAGFDRSHVASMLLRIEQLGRWKPRSTDPDSIWWRDNRSSSP